MVTGDHQLPPSQAGIILERTRQIQVLPQSTSTRLYAPFGRPALNTQKVYSLLSELVSATVTAKSENYFNPL